MSASASIVSPPSKSIRTEAMPRRASCAAMIVPEKPPPMIATGTRSDFIVGPALRVRRARLARLDVIVDSGHGLARGFREPARHGGVHQCGATGADQLRANLHRARAMARPRHPQRTRMIAEQAPHGSRRRSGLDRLVGRHRAVLE